MVASTGRPAIVGLALLVGLMAAGLAVQARDLPAKPLLLMTGVLSLLPLAAVTRVTKPLLLTAWIFSLTYFRVTFPIDSMAGFQGFYVTVADGVFLLVLAFWFYEAVLARHLTVSLPAKLNSGMTLFILPLLLVCFVSALLATRTDWSTYEVIRIAKIPIFLLYCRHNIGKREFWVCLAALGLSIIVQTAMGTLQLRGLLGNYEQEAWAPEPRPNGTLAHASIFSGYMVLLLPIFATLTATLPNRLLQLASATAALMALVGIALTQSRIPWALAILELLAVAVFLVGLKIVSVKRAIGVLAVGGVLGGLVLIPLIGRIERRIASDFDTAVGWRLKMNDVGFDVFKTHPFFGIGLANFPLYLQDTDMEFADSLDDAFSGVYNRPGTQSAPEKGFHWVWVPHNIYILLLAEIGSLGLLAFLFFVGMALRAGIRALKVPDPLYAAAAAGLFIGACSVLIENLADWAMWLDPVLYTWVVAIALLRNIPDFLSAQKTSVEAKPTHAYSVAAS
jgi:O-antigen ligase